MNVLKRTCLILLSLALAASVWGCASQADPQDTILPPDTTENVADTTQPEDTTAPQTTLDFEEVTDPAVDVTIGLQPVVPPVDPVTGGDAATDQIRIHTGDSGWQSAFNQENGCFALVSSVVALNELKAGKLAGFDMDLSAYDEAFFEHNRLVLIPRSSNSGSVKYQAKLNVDDEFIHISLDAHMPEVGTMDMAQWLVLVTLPRGEYGPLPVTVPEAGGVTGNQVRK